MTTPKPRKSPEQEAYNKFLALNLLAETDGGKIVITSLLSDITRSIEALSTEYRTASHFDLVRHCSDLNSRLSLYRALTRAETKLKEVDAIIKEALEDTNE